VLEKAEKMPDQRARLCPYCRTLNSADERSCHRCGRALPGSTATGALGAARQLLDGDAPITRGLLGWCLLLSGLCIATDRHIPLWLTDSFQPRTLLRFGALMGPAGSLEPWRYLGAVFLHVNVLHIAVNGWSLASIGPLAEGRFGRVRYLVLFIVSGVLGFIASSLWYGPAGPLTVGASGAICGLVGSVVGDAYARRDPAWKSILSANLVNLAILALMLPVNNAAHFGGMAVGAALGFAFCRERRHFILDRVYLVLAVLSVLLAPTSVILSNSSSLWRPAPRDFPLEP